jgi:hypothetical protein
MEELLKLKKYYEEKIEHLEKEKYKCKFMYEPEKNIKCKLNKIEYDCTVTALKTVNEDIENLKKSLNPFNGFNPGFPNFPAPTFPSFPSMPAPNFPDINFSFSDVLGIFTDSKPKSRSKSKHKSRSKSKKRSKSKSRSR